MATEADDTRRPLAARRRRWPVILAVALLALAAGSVIAWPWVEAARLLTDLAGGRGPLMAAQAVAYTGTGGSAWSGDLYAAVPGRAPTGLVVVPGAAVAGKDDPRLRRFASAMARVGFTVLVPDIESERSLRLGPDNIDAVADAVDWLAGQHLRVGAVAISYAVGPTILAGLREGDKLAFIVGIGGYYDLTAVVGFFTTGRYFEDGAWRDRHPNPYGKWLFLRSNAARLWDSGDQALLGLMAERRLADPQARIDDLAPRLTPTARPIYDLMVNTQPERVPALLRALPPGVGDDIAALDLKGRDLSGLKAHLLLIHGRDDSIVPSGESRKLAAAAPSAELFVVDDLRHTEFTRPMAGVTLLSAVRAVLAQRAGRCFPILPCRPDRSLF
jgi:pimeloyl-ACP methyl ester carboxylesterase